MRGEETDYLYGRFHFLLEAMLEGVPALGFGAGLRVLFSTQKPLN